MFAHGALFEVRDVALRGRKEKAARIANAKAGGEDVGKKGGQGENYEDRTVDELQERAPAAAQGMQEEGLEPPTRGL